MSEDENGLTCLKGYVVKKLSWERTTLRNAKKALDDAYIKSLQNPANPIKTTTNSVVEVRKKA